MVKKQLYISPKVELMEIDEEGSMMTASVEGMNAKYGSWEDDAESGD